MTEADSAWQLKVDETRHELDSLQDFCEALDRLLPQTRRSLRLFVPELDPELLSRQPVIETLGSFIRGSRYARMDVLFADSDSAIKSSHQLVAFAQRFPSFIEMRKLASAEARSPAWIIFDDAGLIWRHDYRRYEQGFARCAYRARAKALIRIFDDLWNVSKPDPQLKRLHL